jgi:hypothetical protein
MNRFADIGLTRHGGSNEEWQSDFMLDLESKYGIIMLTKVDSGKMRSLEI